MTVPEVDLDERSGERHVLVQPTGSCNDDLFLLLERLDRLDSEVQEVRNDLSGGERKPAEKAIFISTARTVIESTRPSYHWVALKSMNLGALKISRKIRGSVGDKFLT